MPSRLGQRRQQPREGTRSGEGEVGGSVRLRSAGIFLCEGRDARTLTDKQRAVLDFIVSFHNRNGTPPSLREIGDEFGIRSPNGVLCHLEALEKKGFILKPRNRSRAIKVLDTGRVETIWGSFPIGV